MQTPKKQVYLYTDGACSGNPGPGGWGAILRYRTTEKELSGGEASTTNNRMELMAAIQGLRCLKEPCLVQLCSDSKYLIDALQKGWVYNWKKQNYKMPGGKLRPNVDLWEQLLELLEQHTVTFVWVKGHAGHPENERCDQLATAQIRAYQEKQSSQQP